MANNALKTICVLAILLFSMFAVSGADQPLPINANTMKVYINGREVSDSNTSYIRDVQRGDEVTVEVVFTPTANLSDLSVEGVIRGYDYSNPIEDITSLFSVRPGVEYSKVLKIKLPENMDQDSYRLRIRLDSRNFATLEKDYMFDISTVEHGLQIKGLYFSPEFKIVAGRTLVTKVRIKNVGEQVEKDVKVEVSIPKLSDITAVTYLDSIDPEEAATTEDLNMEIPECTKEGDYPGTVKVSYKDGDKKVTKDFTVTVSKGTCGSESSESQGVVTFGSESQTVTPGEGGAVYPITVVNTGSSKQTFTIVPETTDFADMKVNPSNVLVLDAGKGETVYLYLSAKDSATAGDHMFGVSIKSGDQVVQQKTLKATVSQGGNWNNVTRGLEIALIVLVILLILIGLVIGFNRLKGNDEKDEEVGQTYY